MCFSLVSMLDFMDQNLTPLKSRLSKLQSWHQNFSCLVGPNEHFYTRCLLSARTSHGTLFYDICSQTVTYLKALKITERLLLLSLNFIWSIPFVLDLSQNVMLCFLCSKSEVLEHNSSSIA